MSASALALCKASARDTDEAGLAHTVTVVDEADELGLRDVAQLKVLPVAVELDAVEQVRLAAETIRPSASLSNCEHNLADAPDVSSWKDFGQLLVRIAARIVPNIARAHDRTLGTVHRRRRVKHAQTGTLVPSKKSDGSAGEGGTWQPT